MKIKNILISQPRPETEKSPYFDIEKKYKVKMDFRPFVQVEGISAKEFRKQKVDICEHTGVIFNSRTSVDHFFRICEELKIQPKDTWKYFCITEAIAHYLQKYVVYRKRKIFFANGNFDDLLEQIKRFPDENLLLPLSDVHKQEIPSKLTKANIKYSKAILHKTVSADFSDVKKLEYDLIVFYSPAGVASLFQNFPDFVQGDICIGAFGLKTAEAVESHNLRLDLKAPTPEAPSITNAIDIFLSQRNK